MKKNLLFKIGFVLSFLIAHWDANAQSKSAFGFASAQYMYINSSSSINFGSATDFTIECWINYSASAANYT